MTKLQRKIVFNNAVTGVLDNVAAILSILALIDFTDGMHIRPKLNGLKTDA